MLGYVFFSLRLLFTNLLKGLIRLGSQPFYMANIKLCRFSFSRWQSGADILYVMSRSMLPINLKYLSMFTGHTGKATPFVSLGKIPLRVCIFKL